jgi:hypothetical protein
MSKRFLVKLEVERYLSGFQAKKTSGLTPILYRWFVREDERLYRIQKRLDDFQEDDVSR